MTGYLKHAELCAWRFGGKCDCQSDMSLRPREGESADDVIARVTRAAKGVVDLAHEALQGALAIGDTVTFHRSPDVADDTRAAFYDGAKATVVGISDDPLLPYALRFEDGATIVAAGEEVEPS